MPGGRARSWQAGRALGGGGPRAERLSYIAAGRPTFAETDVLSVVADAVHVGTDNWLNVFVCDPTCRSFAHSRPGRAGEKLLLQKYGESFATEAWFQSGSKWVEFDSISDREKPAVLQHQGKPAFQQRQIPRTKTNGFSVSKKNQRFFGVKVRRAGGVPYPRNKPWPSSLTTGPKPQHQRIYGIKKTAV